MTAPTVYRFDDNGAPALSGADNTKLISVLKACLVDGYGNKPAAGWTMPYINSDGDTASFRNNPLTGTGFYLNVAKTNSKNIMMLTGYESMTSESDGVNRFGSNNFYVSNMANNVARPWILFADDRIFHFVVWLECTVDNFNTYQSEIKSFCFGDGIPLAQSDRYFCVLFLSSANQNQKHYHTAHGDVTTNIYQYVARNTSGDLVSDTICALIHGGGPRYTGSYPGGNAFQSLPRVLGNEIMSRPYVNDSIRYSFRGYVPGLWLPCHPAADFSNFEQLEIGTHRFIIVKSSYDSRYDSLFGIDISEHWRP